MPVHTMKRGFNSRYFTPVRIEYSQNNQIHEIFYAGLTFAQKYHRKDCTICEPILRNYFLLQLNKKENVAISNTYIDKLYRYIV